MSHLWTDARNVKIKLELDWVNCADLSHSGKYKHIFWEQATNEVIWVQKTSWQVKRGVDRERICPFWHFASGREHDFPPLLIARSERLSEIQVLNCENCNQCLKCQICRIVFAIVKLENNCQQKKWQNCQNFSTLSKNIKIILLSCSGQLKR